METSSRPSSLASDTQTQVLVIGAGPIGLAAAAILGKLGIRVRVIDKNNVRSDKSKALGVQAGTLECLKKAFESSIAEEMVKAGRPTNQAWIHIEDVNPIDVDLGTIPSKHNYILILPQSETEHFLEEEAGKYSVRVERQTKLLAAVERDAKVYSTLKLPNGSIEEVVSDFVIVCDGAHRIVRKLLDIQFEGEHYTGDFILGDVKVKWPWSADSVRLFIRKKGIIASFPMKGDHLYRLILIPKFKIPPANSPDICLNEFKEILAELSDGQIEVVESTWLTRFRVHHGLAHHFQKGRMFLAGDAAHIHSPAGGQGMNTGIQDALNFGFKLAKVLDDKADISSLESYEKERLPVARAVVRSTDFVFKLALLTENRFVNWGRKYLLPKVIGNRFLQRRMAGVISEKTIAEKEIKIYI